MSGASLIAGMTTAAPPVSIIDTAVSDDVFYPASSTASYSLDSSGSPWMNYGTPANYECRATLTSGTFTSGTAGSWLALTSTRTWSVTQSGSVGTKGAIFTLEIRNASTLEVYDSATIDIHATVSDPIGP